MSAFDSDSDIEIKEISKNNNLSNKDFIFNIGKYKDQNKTIEWICKNDKKYATWFICNYKYTDNKTYIKLTDIYNTIYKTNL